MLDQIRPRRFGLYLHRLMRRLDPATKDAVRELGQRGDKNLIQADTATAEMVVLLGRARFNPGLPLQIRRHPAIPASQDIKKYGPFLSAEQARQAAAEHYRSLAATYPHTNDHDMTLPNLIGKLLLRLELMGFMQFSASLPDDHDLGGRQTIKRQQEPSRGRC